MTPRRRTSVHSRPISRTRRPVLEQLEDRLVPAVGPVTLADPSLWGVTGIKASTAPSISADGQLIAFQSDADDLVPNDSNGLADVFVYNRSTNQLALVSVGVNGQAGGGAFPAISPDGRYVAFESNSRKILPSFSNDSFLHLFLRDLQTSSTSLLTVAVNGSDGGNRGGGDSVNAGTSLVTFSADSKNVGFLSRSGNLVNNITFSPSLGRANVFTRNLVSGTTTLVSVGLDGVTDGKVASGPFALSADARYVAFESSASNLDSRDNFALEQVYLRDTLLGTTKLVSADTSNTTGASGHTELTDRAAAISADGRFVVFHSGGNNLVGNTVGGTNSYIRDTRFEHTELVSAASRISNGVGGTVGSEIISANGRWSAFATNSGGLTTLPTNGRTNVYLRNNLTGDVTLVSVNAAGTAGGNGASGIGTFFDFPGGLAFSADGRYLTFRSLATDLVAGVTSARRNLYARDLLSNTTILLTPNADESDGGDGDTDPGVVSADGRTVAFASSASNLSGIDGNSMKDIYVRDLTAGQSLLASARSPLFGPERLSLFGGTLGDISADGQLVVFGSPTDANRQSDLLPGLTGTGDGFGTYVRNRQSGAIQAVDLMPNGQRGGSVNPTAADQGPIITPDGRYVVFLSRSKDLVAGAGITYTAGAHNLFIRDLQTQSTRLVSATPDGSHDVPVPQNTLFAISDDGRYVAFTTNVTTAYAGVTNDGTGHHYILLRDLGDGVSAATTTLVSRTPPDGNGVSHISGTSRSLSLSPDGRYVAFTSNDSNLAAGDANGVAGHDVFRYDRVNNIVALVSKNTAGTGTGNAASESRRNAMSADGRYIAFQSHASNLMAGDTNGRQDVFVRDLQNDTLTLVSVNAAGTLGGNNNSFDAGISADGQHVAFVSQATNLTADTLAATFNVYVRQLGTTTTLVSKNAAGTASGNANSNGLGQGTVPLLSADGRYVIFSSHASNLVAGYVDGNGTGFQQEDLFLRDVQLGLTKALNLNQSGTATGNDHQFNAIVRLSDVGGLVTFSTGAGDLVIGDRNGRADVVTTSVAGFGVISGQVFNDQNANGAKDGAEVGRPFWTVFLDADGDGTRDLNEERVFTDANGNYAFRGLVPGTYTVAVELQPDFQQTLPLAPTSYTATIANNGDTVAARDFGTFLPLPDLQTSNVTTNLADAVASEAVTVSWTVTNVGNAAAIGRWQDAVYLSPTPALGPDARLLALVNHSGGLSATGSYNGSAVVALPPTPGEWHFIVVTDRRQEVDEGANRANNAGATADTLSLTIPTLTLDTPANGQLASAAPDRYFKLDVPAGAAVNLTLDSAAGRGQVDLYVKRGGVPSRHDYDFRTSAADLPDQVLSIPLVQTGDYFVLVHGDAGPALNSAFTLTATQPGLEIRFLGLNFGGNAGRVTVPIHGTNLPRDGVVSLVSGGSSIDAAAVHYTDAALLHATFDLFAQATGTYDVRITNGQQSTTLDAAFTVELGRPLAPVFNLVTPDAVRINRPFGKVVFEYTNPGNIDAVAPLVTLEATNALLRVTDQFGFANRVQFLCISLDGPAGVLQPGQSGSATIEFQLTGGAGEDIELSSFIATAGTAIDWAAHKDGLRLPHIPADAWDAIFANFVASVGGTVGTYREVLAGNASYLSQLGQYTYDVTRLLGFEINKAGNVFGSRALTEVLDVGFPAPGLPLTFGRQFLQDLTGRYTLGPLGRGWTHNWEIGALTDADGNVEITRGGTRRFFQRQADGTYRGDGVLTLVSGAYQLREEDRLFIAFNVDGTLNFVMDTGGNRITAGYTAGRLASLTHSNGDALTLRYNVQGRIDQVTDPADRTTTYSYDGSGEHLLGYTDKFGDHSYSYLTGQANLALNHALSQIAYADNTHVFFGYDARGRLASYQRDGGQEAVAYAYGPFGGTTLTSADGGRTTFLADDAGQLVEVIHASGDFTRYTRDAAGNVVQVTGPLGVTYGYGYDDEGNLTEAVDPLGQRVTFAHDAAGNLVSFRDARGNATTYRPDAAGNLLSVTYADGTGQQFEYDPLGNLSETLNARGQALTLTYYPNGLLREKTYADATTVLYEYDVHGNLTRATDRAGQVTDLEYDAADNLTEINYPDSRFLHFEYNGIGQRTRSTDHTGFVVAYLYDDLGRLERLENGSGALIVEYVYDAVGRLAEKRLGNGTYTTFAYTSRGALASIVNRGPRPGPGQDGPVNSRFDYTHDALGRVARVDSLDGRWDYTYDAAGQLRRAVFDSNNPAVVPDQDLQYEYDAAGNRTRTILNGATTNYVANALNQYTQAGATTFTYDLDGNLATATTAGATTTYTFDQENHLVGSSSATDVFAYHHDAFGQLSAATHNGVTQHYLIDPAGLGNRVAVLDDVGNVLAHYTHGLGLVSQVSTSQGTAYYDFDCGGNTVGLSDATGSYVNHYSYQPFGALATRVESLNNPFTFVGQLGVTEIGTGLLSMRARTYSAVTGQFLSVDPLGLNAGDTNFRRYVFNNPVAHVDPSGLAIFPDELLHPLPALKDTGNLAQARPFKCPEKHAPSINCNFLIEPEEHGGHGGGGHGGGGHGGGGHGGGDGPTFIPGGGGNPPEFFIPADDLGDAYGPGWEYQPYPPPPSPPPGGHGGPGSHSGPGGPGGPNGSGGGGGGGGGSGGGGSGGGGSGGGSGGGHPYPPSPPPPPPGGMGGPGGRITPVGGFDPNELIGPAGFGAPNWLPANQERLPYTIGFENDPVLASAAVQDVVVSQQLDADLDWSTFQLGDIRFGATVVRVPAGLQAFATSVATTNIDGTPLRVDIAAGLNLETGVVTWTFLSLDPVTGLWPENPVAGFLPVNDATKRGQGYLEYSIRARAGLATGTEIRGVASIVFDTNDPVLTNQRDPHDPSQGSDHHREALVTIDAAAPSSNVQALPASTGAPTILLTWSGAEDAGGSGLVGYDILVSTDGGDFEPFLLNTTATSSVFRGTAGHTYAFLSIASDNAGNREVSPVVPDAVTQLVVPNTAVTLTTPTVATVGQVVKLTATIKRQAGAAGAVVGTVTFIAGDTILGSAPVKNVNGVRKASLATTLTVGAHVVEAIYSGSGGLTSSTSAARSVQMRSPTTTTVTSSAPTAVSGSNVTFTATVAALAAGAGVPAGTVSFFDVFNGVKVLLGTVAVTANTGTAALTLSSLKKGTHTLSVKFAPAPGSDFLASKSTGIKQVIQAGASLRTLVADDRNETAALDAFFVALAKEGTAVS